MFGMLVNAHLIRVGVVSNIAYMPALSSQLLDGVEERLRSLLLIDSEKFFFGGLFSAGLYLEDMKIKVHCIGGLVLHVYKYNSC